MDYLKARLKIKTSAELKKKLLLRCRSLNFKQLAKDVEGFLIDPSEVKKVQFFYEYINS